MSSGSETRKRDTFVRARCTLDERAAMEALASNAGKSLSKLIRDELLGRSTPGPGPRRRRPQADEKALAQISGLLGMYGSNLNQLAKVANTNGEPVAGDTLYQFAAEIRQIKLMVLKALGRGD